MKSFQSRQSQWNIDPKLWIAAAGFVLAGAIYFELRPRSAPVNPPIIAIVSNNDVVGVAAAVAENSSALRAVDLDGNTPLHIAAMGGYKDLVDSLIAAGADVNATNKAGYTPIASALLSVETNKAEIIKALAAAGARTDIVVGDGRTLRQIAASLPPERRQAASSSGRLDSAATTDSASVALAALGLNDDRK